MTPPTPKKVVEKKEILVEKKPLKFRVVFLISAGFILFFATLITGYAFWSQNKIVPRTSVAGLSVGGLTKEEAQKKVDTYIEGFKSRKITIHYKAKEWDILGKDISPEFNTQKAIDLAYAQGHEGSYPQKIKQLIEAPLTVRKYGVEMSSLSEDGAKYLQKTILSTIEKDATETSLDLVPGKASVVAGSAGQKVNSQKFYSDLARVFSDEEYSQIDLEIQEFEPRVTEQGAEGARKHAQKLLENKLILQVDQKDITISAQDLISILTTSVADTEPATLKLVVDQEETKKFLARVAEITNQKAKNAVLGFTNGKITVTQNQKKGIQLDQDKTLVELEKFLASDNQSNTIIAITKVEEAKLRSDNVKKLGITELIGTATTDYSGSPANRVFNINKGQESISGSMVSPGETFSTTGTLGPVEVSTGYLPELVIKGSRTVPEAGGGLCQVSTTLFRAVLNAGMPIVERSNHAYRVGYYEREVGPGLDATVYIPNPDFKWKNDTKSAIYIQSFIEGTKITFQLYGTSDGRKAVISEPTILETIPVGAPIYAETETLKKGVVQQVETAHAGAKTKVNYTVTRDGQVIYTEDFYSNYKPWPAQFLVGIGV